MRDDDSDVTADGPVVRRIMKDAAEPVGAPWMWTLAFGIMTTARQRTATSRRGKHQDVAAKKSLNSSAVRSGISSGKK
jgi:hypothetical protein